MKAVFLLVLLVSMGVLNAREVPWKSSSKTSSETPWSEQNSSETKERRESFFRELEPQKSSVKDSPRLEVPGTKVEDSKELEALPWKRFEAEGSKDPFGKLFLWPVENGRISSGYGLRDSGFHEGIDIAAYRGSPVRAASSGVVVYSDRLGTYGRTVVISHGEGIATLYAHLEKTFVKRGARIKQGVVLGSVGNSGRADGFHLHFEVRKGGEALNPLSFSFQRQPLYAGLKGSSND